jgi:hypothetical protein
MSHCIRRIGTFSALVVMAAVSGIAQAEDSTDPPDQRPARNAGDEGRKRSDAKGPSDRAGASERKASAPRAAAPAVPGRVNEAFTFPLAGGCDYSSTVRGTVRAAKGATGEEPKYVPSLTVNAWISCQNNTEMRVIDSTLRDAAMTRAELEQAIELRASLLADNGSVRCAYVPDFSLTENKLTGVGVFYLCPGGGAQAGGGSLDDLPADDTQRPMTPADKPPQEGRTPPSGRPSAEKPAPETRGAVDHRTVRERSPSDDSH